jgi:predicted ester cyclase
MGVPASGRKVSGGAIEVFRVGNGKILEERTEMDALGLLQQLGLVTVGE